MLDKSGKWWVPLALVLLVLAAGCEKSDWKQAQKSRSVEGYEEYIGKYPRGKYVQAAWKRIERLEFRKAKSENTTASYREYLSQFPEGEHAKEARNRFNRMFKHMVSAFTVEQMAGARVVAETSMGNFTLALFPDKAPEHCRNLLYLSLIGFHDNQIVNMVKSGEFVRLGDPGRGGVGGPGYMIKAEINDLATERGLVLMWHVSSEPDSAGSQMIILLTSFPEFDGKYTVFARVAEGLSVVEAISRAPVRGGGGKTGLFPLQPILIRKFRVEGLGLEQGQ